MAACGCGVSTTLPKKIRRDELEELSIETKLTPPEVEALYARFRRLAARGYLEPEQFKRTMGVLGLSDDPFLPDRMFHVFDRDDDGKLSFREFATSLAIMIRGTEDEKLKLSFEMTAGRRGAAGIKLEDFQRLVVACNTMLSSLVAPTRGITSEEDIRRLFHDLSTDEQGDQGDYITLDAYKAAAQSSEDFLLCLGLEPNVISQRRTRRCQTGHQLGASNRLRATPKGGPSSGSLTPHAHAATGHVMVSAAQLDDIRERVMRIHHLVHKEPSMLRASSQSSSPSRAKSPEVTEGPLIASADGEAHAEDPDEHWWTPLPRRQLVATAPHRLGPSGLMLDEITTELDRVLGFCAHHEVGQTSTGDHEVSQASAQPLRARSSGGRANPFGMTAEEPRTPSTLGGTHGHVEDSHTMLSEFSRNFSGQPEHLRQERSAAQLRKGNIHAPERGARDSCGHDAADLRANTSVLQRRGSASMTQTFGPSRRRKKRHRLLGPQKGLAVHFGHENWNMVLSMMIGIRMSVGRSRHEIHRELQPVDFAMKEKFSIIPRMVNIFDAAVSSRVTMTRFIDYAPLVFQKIRQSFDINHDDYLRSVGPEQLLGNMVLGNLSSLAELSSEGKSGAFFYYTADGNYMMKTVTPKEYTLLRRMLKQYFEHITQNPGTLIVRFLGLHCLSVRKARKGIPGVCENLPPSCTKLYFVVMANMFNAPFEIHRRYDLKGSWVGRTTPAEKYDPTVALKDVDFKNANEAIRVGEEVRSKLLQQIERDTAFLSNQNIIDYSLLLGIHDTGAQGNSEEEQAFSDKDGRAITDGGRVSQDGSHTEAPQPGRPPRLSDDIRLPLPDSAFRSSTSTLCAPVEQRASHASDCPLSPMSVYTTASQQREAATLHRRDGGGLLSPDRRTLYFLGIIDILTPYDTFKKFEHGFKAMRYDSRGVSCCPPKLYAERFNSFMKSAFV